MAPSNSLQVLATPEVNSSPFASFLEALLKSSPPHHLELYCLEYSSSVVTSDVFPVPVVWLSFSLKAVISLSCSKRPGGICITLFSRRNCCLAETWPSGVIKWMGTCFPLHQALHLDHMLKPFSVCLLSASSSFVEFLLLLFYSSRWIQVRWSNYGRYSAWAVSGRPLKKFNTWVFAQIPYSFRNTLKVCVSPFAQLRIMGMCCLFLITLGWWSWMSCLDSKSDPLHFCAFPEH